MVGAGTGGGGGTPFQVAVAFTVYGALNMFLNFFNKWAPRHVSKRPAQHWHHSAAAHLTCPTSRLEPPGAEHGIACAAARSRGASFLASQPRPPAR